jgi:hypothetical protein
MKFDAANRSGHQLVAASPDSSRSAATALRIGTNVIGFPSLDNKLWLENSYLWALALLL